jgi:hypothetical protein
MNQQCLLDDNLYKVISKCFINTRRPDKAEIYVIYSDGDREPIWTFNPTRHDFTHHEFVGKTKIEAVFYCDRKAPRNIQLY